MSQSAIIEKLGEWEGYCIGTADRMTVANGITEIWLELLPAPDHIPVCSHCGHTADSIHQSVERWVRDLPLFGFATRLLVHRRRIHCPYCGPKLEHLSWLEPCARVTKRLSESVARLSRLLPIKQVAAWFDLDWKTVKRIDKHALERELGPVDLSNVTMLAMDMNGAFIEEVRARCPNAEIVYDLFHVVAKFGREVIDRVRVDEANRLRNDKKARKVIKGARWLLLWNPHNVSGQERVRLNELLAANRRLYRVYVLKEDLKYLWEFNDPAAAKRFFADWYDRAIRSRIEPLIRFARNLKTYMGGIISHCRYPLHTSLLEGMNNKIKVIKRMAYGFHDDEYFFLKIRAAFHAIGR